MMTNYLNAIDDAIGKPDSILPEVLSGYKPLDGGEYTDYQKYTGGYCVVYPLGHPNKPNKCIRLWYKESNKDYARDLAGKLKSLHNEGLTFLIGYEYFNEGLKLDNGEVIPAVVMDWIEGDTLNDYIKKYCFSSAIIKQLAIEFFSIISIMNLKGLAHGDLSSENIIVMPNKKMVLIDYDSFYIEGISENVSQTTKGTPGYQHPERKKMQFLSYNMDYFSQQVIYLSILAVAEKPSLASKENMLIADKKMFFEAKDFRNINSFIESDGYKAIASINNNEIKSRLEELKNAVNSRLENVKSIVGHDLRLDNVRGSQNNNENVKYNNNEVKRTLIDTSVKINQPEQKILPPPTEKSKAPWYKNWYIWICATIVTSIFVTIIPYGKEKAIEGNTQKEQIIITALNNLEGNYTFREKNGSTPVNGIRTAAIKKKSDTEARILVTSEYGPEFYDFTFTSDGKIQSEKLGTGEIAYNERLDKITITFKEGERICEFTK